MEYHSSGLQEKLIEATISQLLHRSVIWKELHGVLHGRSCWEFTPLAQLHVKLHMKLLKKLYQRGPAWPRRLKIAAPCDADWVATGVLDCGCWDSRHQALAASPDTQMLGFLLAAGHAAACLPACRCMRPAARLRSCLCSAASSLHH